MRYYLFVCQHNFTRSKFGAEFLRGYLKGKNIEAKVLSAGLGFLSYFLGRRINKKLINKSHKIFVMEGYMKKYLINKFKVQKSKIIVLKIKDEYGFLKNKSVDDLDKFFQKVDWRKFL